MSNSQATPPRNAAAIVDDLYTCSIDMMQHLDDADVLIQQVDRRQELAEEFAAYRNSGKPLYATAQEKEQAEGFLVEIAEMAPKIVVALERLRDEAKDHLTSLKTNQRVLRYTNSAISGSGSYMDYKK